MKIGVPTETKAHEYRVSLTPHGAAELARRGAQVLVQAGAGERIGFRDADYRTAGARILQSAADVFAGADLILKVKEPQPAEVALLRPESTLFTYLHLAANPELTRSLLDKRITAIAYETVTDPQGRLPLLVPMSQIAGRLSIQAGANHLENVRGGRGVLLGGVPGVAPGVVLIIGAGMVGLNAARMAVGLGAEVLLLDRDLDRLREADNLFGGRVKTLLSTPAEIEASAARADLVIGAVLVPGDAAPKVLPRATLKRMQAGSVVVDVAIDQGGCFETSHPTTHDAPTFVVDDIVHYCVANMPGAVARTATLALVNATLPYVIAIAEQGVGRALQKDAMLRAGLNAFEGAVTHPGVAHALSLELKDAAEELPHA